MHRRIIIGFDPGHEGPDVMRLGRILAEVLAAKPMVVTAVPWPSYLTPAEDLREQIELELSKPFDLIEDEMSDLGVVTKGLASRSPAATLQEEAEQESAGLIVVGSSHRGPIGRTLAGSVGESLLHGSNTAVAIAPRGYARRTNRMRRIGVAFDGSAEAWTAVDTALGLCARMHADLTVIAVADYEHYGYATSWSILIEGEFHDAEREEKQRMADSAANRAPYGVRVETRVETGHAGSVLAEISPDFDLLIAGSRAYGPLRRTMLGSTTRRLIRSSACPVLVLPRAAGPDPLGVADLAGRTDRAPAASS